MSNQETTNNRNALVHSKSPYLLQHANNPVQWHEWKPESLQLSKQQDKPILLSVGYSACHWCHVMAHESFENELTAQIMNENFICIKLDREERPDVDAIYMEAVQSMGIHGGWPLNVFLLPDLRPFYGGTYFPNVRWNRLLEDISSAFQNHRLEIEDSAAEFTKSIQRSETEKYRLSSNSNSGISKETAKLIFQNLKSKFDKEYGGLDRSPKFPLPNIWQYVQHHAWLLNDQDTKGHLEFTLDWMANSGLYDWVEGGFARYSVDAKWFAPHFEKMLYDNAQMLSLYANAYKWTKKPLYKEVIDESISFLISNLKCSNGGFYSALDADSEGIEGKYYVFTYVEILDLIDEDDLSWFCEYFLITKEGNWEHDFNILYPRADLAELAKKHKLNELEIVHRLEHYKIELLNYRSKRISPGLDDKILCSWNGLLLSGLSDAYAATLNQDILEEAKNLAYFIHSNFVNSEGHLFHAIKNQEAYIEGNLEDYATVISGFIAYYQVSGDAAILVKAKELLEATIKLFYDPKDQFFFFATESSDLIARKKELFDNVIPSSNSIMARNLRLLSIHFENAQWNQMALAMLNQMNNALKADVSYLTNWAQLYLEFLTPQVELAIATHLPVNDLRLVISSYLPALTIAAGTSKVGLPLLGERNPEGEKSLFFICQNHTCLLPLLKDNFDISTIQSLLSAVN